MTDHTAHEFCKGYLHELRALSLPLPWLVAPSGPRVHPCARSFGEWHIDLVLLGGPSED